MLLSSHPSAVRLLLDRDGGCLRPLCAFRVRRAENARVVADKHHAEESTGDFTQPAEATEYEECCGDQPRDVQSGHIALSEVAEEVAEHIEETAAGGSP